MERPGLQTWSETFLRVSNCVPTHGVARASPPPARAFPARQPRPWNKRVVFHAEELHELDMLIRRRSPCPDKRAGGQLMEHQLVVSHVALLFFQRRHPAATKDQPNSDHD